MTPKSNSQSSGDGERRLLVISQFDAAIAELYDTLDRSKVIIEVLPPTPSPSPEVVARANILITDHELPESLVKSLDGGLVSIWVVGKATSEPARRHRATSWGAAINALAAALTQEVGGMRLAPSRGILAANGGWFRCDPLESLLINYPEWTTLSPLQRRASKSAVANHCPDGRVSVTSSGEFCKLVMKSEDSTS